MKDKHLFVTLGAFAVLGARALVAGEVVHEFLYDGVPAEWLTTEPTVRKVTENDRFVRSVREWTSPDGRLTLRSTKTDYKRFPAVEYLPELVGRGDADTGIVADFHSLALTCPGEAFTLRTLKGTKATERDFEAVHFRLGEGGEKAATLTTDEGRSSAEWMPWWDVDFADGSGLVCAVGWTGAWRADFMQGDGKMKMTAGMVKTHFRLHPGETLRQPSVLVFRRDKAVSPRAMLTLVHRFMLDEKCPRNTRGELVKPLLPITAGGGNKTPEMMKKVLSWSVGNKMPFDCFWVDAGWNGPAHLPDLISNCGNMWPNFVGDWRFNPTVHPDGNLAEVSAAVHAAGMKMLLWVEPERCVSDPPPPLFREHRDWLLPVDDAKIRNQRELNVNLGEPAACDWMIETISRLVRENRLDVYRQDFNINTLPLWQENDAEDRQGVTEAKYIAGLYRFWDELRRRFPDLLIENCASGGRRLDFEAVSRAHSYCRTDYAIGQGGPTQVTDMQNVTLNTLAYQPFQGSETRPAHFFDDYGFFSSVCAASVFTPSDWNAGIVKNPFSPEETAWFKKVFGVADRMRRFFTGDYYPLVDVTPPVVGSRGFWFPRTVLPDEGRWCAYQMHLSDLDAGFAIAFRRLDAPNADFSAKLSAIDPTVEYEIETYGADKTRMLGVELSDWHVRLERPRDFRLVFYRKIK